MSESFATPRGYRHEWYLRYAIRDGERTAQATAGFIKDVLDAFDAPIDAIAFTGMSGALIAPRVATILGLPIIMVRKPHDGSHSDYRVEGFIESECYLIVDDFACTGTTVRSICEAIESAQAYTPKQAACFGVVQYNEIMDGSPDYALSNTGIPDHLRFVKGDGRLIVVTASNTGLLSVEVSEIGEFDVNTKLRSVSTDYTYAIVSERG